MHIIAAWEIANIEITGNGMGINKERIWGIPERILKAQIASGLLVT